MFKFNFSIHYEYFPLFNFFEFMNELMANLIGRALISSHS